MDNIRILIIVIIGTAYFTGCLYTLGIAIVLLFKEPGFKKHYLILILFSWYSVGVLTAYMIYRIFEVFKDFLKQKFNYKIKF